MEPKCKKELFTYSDGSFLFYNITFQHGLPIYSRADKMF